VRALLSSSALTGVLVTAAERVRQLDAEQSSHDETDGDHYDNDAGDAYDLHV